jgi:drug/metabolite transporter (DMT)-like permease
LPILSAIGDKMTAPANRRMSTSDWSILGVLSLLWGGSFYFLALALKGLPPFTIVLGRVGFAAMLLYFYMRIVGQKLPTGRTVWTSFFVVAFFANALPFVMFAYGQQTISSGLASILNATTPLWGVLVAHFFTSDERATPGKVAGVMLGIGGVAAMTGSDALAGLGGNVLGQAACLVATFAYAIAGVYSRRFKGMGITPLAVSTGQLTAAALLVLPLVLVFEQPWTLQVPSASVLWGMAGLVTLSTTFAYVLFFRLIETAGASNTLLVTFLIPVTAILLGVFALGETLLPKHLLGMALIALGLAAIDGRPFGWLQAVASRRAVP